jgi:hypothetical protein
MRIFVLALVILFLPCYAQQPKQKSLRQTELAASGFAVSKAPAIEALLELSRQQGFPLGIIMDDDRLCRSTVSFSGDEVPFSEVLSSIMNQVPGYGWSRAGRSPVIHIAPSSIRPVTQEFLDLVDPHYGPMKANLQTLVASLWVHIRYILHPDEGTVGDILSSTHDEVFEIEDTNASVEALLDQIAITTTGTWILRPLPPRISSIGDEMPFHIFQLRQVQSYTTDLCSPLNPKR